MSLAKKLPEKQNEFEFQSASRAKILELSQLDSWRACWPLAFDWLCIGLSISASLYFASPVAYLLTIIIIATRQHALLVMVHEGAHYRFHRNRNFNDFLANVFAAYPIFFCTNAYRLHHYAHHQYLNTDQDPDWARKAHLPEWQFPKSNRNLALTFLKVACTSWYKLIAIFWALSGLGSKTSWTDPAKRKFIFYKLVFYSAVAATLWTFSAGLEFFMYWIVPYLVILPVIERLRSISEHFALAYEHDLNQARNVLCGPFEAFVFGQHNVRYHLDHHLFPMVPQYRLPELHAYLNTFEDYAAHAHNNDSYLFGKKSVRQDAAAAN